MSNVESPPPERTSLLGRYIHGQPVPKVWQRIFDFIIWTLPIALLGDGAATQHGGGGMEGDARFDGGSCVCGSEPKLCGKFPDCTWKPKKIANS